MVKEWAINLCVNTKSFLFIMNRHTKPLKLDKLKEAVAAAAAAHTANAINQERFTYKWCK